ncbi:helix-turn-helix domain-containing protein [Thermodesulfobacteriota bacterium]
MTDIRSKIGENIRALRKRRNISQEVLAFKAGLHRTYIGSVERGERNISIDAIEKISIALNISIEELTKGL